MISACVTEADGILRWLIDGYTEWRSHGLNDPATVTTATSGYRAKVDALGRFLDQGTHRSSLAASLFGRWGSCSASGMITSKGTSRSRRQIPSSVPRTWDRWFVTMIKRCEG
jgi:phage/plasmid-associated DNA primase